MRERKIIGVLGRHPRHPGRPAVLDQHGQPLAIYATEATRAEIAEQLADFGYELRPDDTIVRRQ